MVISHHSYILQEKGRLMDLKLPTSDPIGFIQWIVVAAIAVLFLIPKALREYRAESNMVERLLAEISAEREKRTQAEHRADQFAAERNRLVLEFSDMKRDNALVLKKLEDLEQQNALLTEQNAKLTRKVEELTATLERLSNVNPI